jgi:hypothetical protein
MSLLGHSRQDISLSMGNIFFCITLVPMLRQPGRPPLLTCVPTGLGLLAGGFVFATLHLWVTALTQVTTGLQWLAFAVKKHSDGAVASEWASLLESREITRFARRFCLALAFTTSGGRHLGCVPMQDIAMLRGANCHRRPFLAKLIFALDRWLQRRAGVSEYSEKSDCIFRVQVSRLSSDVRLSDGTCGHVGDRVLL